MKQRSASRPFTVSRTRTGVASITRLRRLSLQYDVLSCLPDISLPAIENIVRAGAFFCAFHIYIPKRITLANRKLHSPWWRQVQVRNSGMPRFLLRKSGYCDSDVGDNNHNTYE